MIERFTHIMINSGAGWVLWVLLALSAASVAIACERWLAFRATRGDLERLVPGLRRHLLEQDVDSARALLEASRSLEARVVTAGLAEAERGAAAAEAAMAAASGLERRRLEKHLLFLGTVGNNAPFIGLLGTVIGVVGAFDALGKPQLSAAASALAPERVMGTIAEALVATAVGLLVAIPAVAVFNHFQGRLVAALRDAETLGQVLLAHLRAERESRLVAIAPERHVAARSATHSRRAGDAAE